MMEVLRIGSFDGQIVWLANKTELFEVGNFLGGGAAGTVYECEHVLSHNRFALKILNPLGYKIISPALLRRLNISTKGKVFNDATADSPDKAVSKEHVWWVVNGQPKQYLACYYSQKQNTLRELSLSQCMEIWGTELTPQYEQTDNLANQGLALPAIPSKYIEFLRKRNQIFREIRNMRKISNHRNVIKLEAVLELIQESKSTIFLVMELANGGELFDRIKLDCGTREETARIFFRQLIEGVKHCHDQGVCHRDLKPENLLLQDDGVNGTILKIADFGFSAHFFIQNDDSINASNNNNNSNNGNNNENGLYFASPNNKGMSDESPLRILKSIVGSPFYVAPEIVQQSSGYDGAKADIWSMGVILYAMLAGNLPFGQELNNCKRFRHFCKWIRELPSSCHGLSFWLNPTIEYPTWLFPPKFSANMKGLIVSMLHPDPEHRITMIEVMTHPLCEGIMYNDDDFTRTRTSSSLIPSSSLEINMRSQQGMNHPMNTPATPGMATHQQQQQQQQKQQQQQMKPPVAAMEEDLSSPLNPLEHGETLSGVKSHSDHSDRSDSQVQDYADEIAMFAMEEEDEFHSSSASSQPSKQHVHSPPEPSYHTNKSNSNTSSSTSNQQSHVFQFGQASSTAKVPVAPQPENNVAKRLNFGAAVVPTSSSTMDVVDDPSPSREERKSLSGSLSVPPILPPQYMSNTTAVRDLLPINCEDDEDGESSSSSMPTTPHHASAGSALTSPFALRSSSHDILPATTVTTSMSTNTNTTVSNGGRSNTIPAFHDMVKRSTRFTTTVPANDVLEKVHSILVDLQKDHLESPAGYIGRVDVNWENYRIEVFGMEYPNIALCALQIYQIPSTSQGQYPFGSPEGTRDYLQFQSPPTTSSSSSSLFSSSLSNGSSMPAQLLMVEFVRGQLDIFAFKRFYQWVRVKLSELVKRDYAMSFFQAASPMTYYSSHMSSLGVSLGKSSQ